MNQRMNELLGHAMGVITEFWENYDDEHAPFGQRMETYVDYPSTQFDNRMKVLERDRGKSVDEIVKAAVADLAEDELAHASTAHNGNSRYFQSGATSGVDLRSRWNA